MTTAGLVNPRGHRLLLDRYAGTDTAGLERAYADWARTEAQLAEARGAVEQAKADQDLLIAHLAELAALEPVAGEEARLAGARADMQKGEKLSDDLETLRHLWEGSDSPLASLRVAARKLDRIAEQHALLAEALAALDRAVIEATEAEDKLRAAAEALVHDPHELERAETRLFELRAAARKHRCEVDDLPELMRTMRSRLDAIEGGEAQLDALEAAAKEARTAYVAAAEAAHAARVAGAERLDAAVAAELAPLKLDAARFRTAITPLPEERWNAHGHGRGGVPDLDQPRRGFCALGQDCERRGIVALHPRAEGRAG